MAVRCNSWIERRRYWFTKSLVSCGSFPETTLHYNLTHCIQAFSTFNCFIKRKRRTSVWSAINVNVTDSVEQQEDNLESSYVIQFVLTLKLKCLTVGVQSIHLTQFVKLIPQILKARLFASERKNLPEIRLTGEWYLFGNGRQTAFLKTSCISLWGEYLSPCAFS